MDPDIVLPTLLLVLALLATNAFFVTAEFALLTLHRGRVEQEARDGDAGAGRLLPALAAPGSLLLTAQLGGSVSTLLLGVVVARLALAWVGPGSLTRTGAGSCPTTTGRS